MTVIFASAGFLRVLGFDPEKLLGQNFVQVGFIVRGYFGHRQYVRAAGQC